MNYKKRKILEDFKWEVELMLQTYSYLVYFGHKDIVLGFLDHMIGMGHVEKTDEEITIEDIKDVIIEMEHTINHIKNSSLGLLTTVYISKVESFIRALKSRYEIKEKTIEKVVLPRNDDVQY